MERGQQAGAKAGATDSSGKPGASAKPGDRPDWSHGLRQLYDSVVEEDLPDSFRDLLDRLDESDPDSAEKSASGHPPTKGDGA
jgi:hypothetical protein